MTTHPVESMDTVGVSGPAGPAAPAAQAAPAPVGVLPGLHPGWFGAVMGTAAVGMAAYGNPGGLAGTLSAAHAVGVTLVLLAAVLAVVVLVADLARAARHPRQVLTDLRHPVAGAMFATVPGGLLVLAVATNTVAQSLPLSRPTVVAVIAVLTAVGAVLGLVFSLVFAVGLFTGTTPAPMVNGGWFIPPVVTIIIPVALAALVPDVGAGTRSLFVALGYAFFGMGLLLFLLVMTLLHDRLVLHPMPAAPLAPTLWIALGPVGVGALVLPALAKAGAGTFGASAAAVATISRLAATALWGFGAWWVLVAIVLLVRYLRSGPLPFTPGWWGFTFPLAAFTLSTIGLAHAWDTPVLTGIGVGLFVLLALVWLTVLVATLRAIATGVAWRR